MRLFELFDYKPNITRTMGAGENSDFQYAENDFQINDQKYRCEIKIHKDVKMITVNFKSKNKYDNWSIARQDNQPAPTKVFGAVINLLMPYAKQFPNFNIFFRSEESGSRERLYDVIATNLAKQLGRHLDVERHDDRGAGYTIIGNIE